MTVPESQEEGRARVARSNRVFGLWCSVIGGILLVVAAVIVYGVAVVVTVGSDGSAAGAATTWVGVLLLFAMCALILGEQLRRGSFGVNPNPPDTLLPSASVRSSFRLLSTGWHALWTVVAFVVALTFLVPVIIGFTTGSWPHSLDDSGAVETPWTIYGAFAFGVGTGLLGSLSKKTFTAAHAGVVPPERGRKAWRFWLYRWRIDVWLSGIGGFLVALCAVFLCSAVDEYDTPVVGLVVTAVIGLVLVVVGILLGRGFWRTGESLGSGESFA